MRTVILLGPQRQHPTLAGEVDRIGIDGPIAIVTAGWQEREAEDEELREHLGCPVMNLELHRRLEEVFAEDPELFEAHRARQNRLRAMQQLYRYRLDFALEPARELLRRDGDPKLLDPERRAAIAALRELDRGHLERIREVHRDFEERHHPPRRGSIARCRDELAQLLEKASALVLAGGHVAVLINRLRLLGVVELAGELPVLAWSAGAMALAERIVLFHDSPPQGMGNPEILDQGLGLVPNVVVLPHARHRLRLEDPPRVEILARRFKPAVCVPFDHGSPAIRWRDGHWILPPGTRRLLPSGRVVEVGPRESA